MSLKRKQKQEREQSILLGLIDLYLLTRKPIGSNTLRNNGFEDLSSATIRNYFCKLESQGFLEQQHSSGGRIPTTHAYKFYAMHHLNSQEIDTKTLKLLKEEMNEEGIEVTAYLQKAAHLLSRLAQSAVFLSSPRFDQDFITSIQLLAIDQERYLAALKTNFGLIRTEILPSPKKLSRFALKRIESYFHFRLTGLGCPSLSKEEEKIARQFYNELLLRYIVHHSNFNTEDIYKTGFSQLLNFPEFQDASILATGLSLFENAPYLRKILNHCLQSKNLKCWIGDDLDLPQAATLYNSVIAIPYSIHGKPVGAIALLVPIPTLYPKLFGILRAFSMILSDTLTHSLYKHEITYRQPSIQEIDTKQKCPLDLSQVDHLQIEDQR